MKTDTELYIKTLDVACSVSPKLMKESSSEWYIKDSNGAHYDP